MAKLTVAAIQMQSGRNLDRNLSTAMRLIDEAIARGAQFIALPELFAFYGPLQLLARSAEPVPGPIIDLVREKARAAGVYILAGSVAESIPENGRIFNTSALIDSHGRITASYQKMHLFDVDLTGHTSVRESSVFERGDRAVVADTDHGKVGLTVCYDLRFPELYRHLALQGAGIIFVASCFMQLTGKDHWEPLLRARAIENQVFVVAPNQTGPIVGTDLVRHGHSAIIDPWGTVLAMATEPEQAIVAELNFDRLNEVRRQIPCMQNRRPDVYHL